MNIIFLDIDGVICTEKAKVAFGSECFDPCSCILILDIARRHNCKIVLHSSWRTTQKGKLSGYKMFLCSLKIAIKGSGIYKVNNFLFPEMLNKHVTIGDEHTGEIESIQNWLEAFGGDVDDFLIIDSKNLITPEYSNWGGHFLRVENPSDGFGYLEWLKADSYLGRNKNKVKQI